MRVPSRYHKPAYLSKKGKDQGNPPRPLIFKKNKGPLRARDKENKGLEEDLGTKRGGVTLVVNKGALCGKGRSSYDKAGNTGKTLKNIKNAYFRSERATYKNPPGDFYRASPYRNKKSIEAKKLSKQKIYRNKK
jgi:hypothetical protein